LPTYLSEEGLNQLLGKDGSPINLKEICKYLNKIHHDNGIVCCVSKNGTSLNISGKNIAEHFVLESDKLRSISPSMNETCIHHTHTILETLENKNVGIIPTFFSGWHQLYYRSKQGFFLTYNFWGGIATLNKAAAASLASATGAAPVTLNGLMALSFFFGISFRLAALDVPEGRIKKALQVTGFATGSLVSVFQWSFNKLTGLVEIPFKKLNILPEKSFDIDVAGPLGVLEGPVDISFNETFKQLQNWTKKGYIIYEQTRDVLNKPVP
jgi:hypothetical protein